MSTHLILAFHGTSAVEDFERFARSDDIGYHFGTAETANTRLSQSGAYEAMGELEPGDCGPRVIPVVIEVERIVRVADCHTWLNGEARRELLAAGVLSQAEHDEFEDSGWIPAPEELVERAEARGIHALVYTNGTEGGGDSYLVFNPERVHFALQRPDLVRQALARRAACT